MMAAETPQPEVQPVPPATETPVQAEAAAKLAKQQEHMAAVRSIGASKPHRDRVAPVPPIAAIDLSLEDFQREVWETVVIATRHLMKRIRSPKNLKISERCSILSCLRGFAGKEKPPALRENEKPSDGGGTLAAMIADFKKDTNGDTAPKSQ